MSLNTTHITGLHTSLSSYNLVHGNVSAQKFGLSDDTANNLGYGVGRILRGAFDGLWNTWQKMWVPEPSTVEIARQRNYMIYKNGLRECVKLLAPALAELQIDPRNRGALKKVEQLALHFAHYLKPSREGSLRELQNKILQPLEEKVSAMARPHIKNALSEWMPVFFQGGNSAKAQTELQLAHTRRSQVMQAFPKAKGKHFSQESQKFPASFNLATLDGASGFAVTGTIDQQNQMSGFYESCLSGLVLGSFSTITTQNSIYLILATLNCMSVNVEAHIEMEMDSDFFQKANRHVWFNELRYEITDAYHQRYKLQTEKITIAKVLNEVTELSRITNDMLNLVGFLPLGEVTPSVKELLRKAHTSTQKISAEMHRAMDETVHQLHDHEKVLQTLYGKEKELAEELQKLPAIVELPSPQPQTALQGKIMISAPQFRDYLERILTIITTNKLLTCEKNESGFIRINIAKNLISENRDDIRNLRLHFWPKRDTNITVQQETVHSHPIYFESYVVNGGYTHQVYKVGNEEDPIYERFVLRETLTGHKYRDFDKKYRLKMVNEEAVHPGDIVAFPHPLIHRVLGATQEETLTLNAVIPSEKDMQQFSVFIQSGGADEVKTERKTLDDDECKGIREQVEAIISRLPKSSSKTEL